MNAREEARRMAEVMCAFADGARIQAASRLNKHNWNDLPPWASPRFDWDHNDYRVKPKPREVWVKFDPCGRPTWVYQTESEISKDMPVATGTTYIRMREVTE